MSSCCESIEVFNSKGEDDPSEQAGADFTCKFENRNLIDGKCFTQCVVQGSDTKSMEVDNLPIDFDNVDGNHNCDNGFSYSHLGKGEDCVIEGVFAHDAVTQINSRISELCPLLEKDKIDDGSICAGLLGSSIPLAVSSDNCQLDCSHRESSSNDESFDKVSDANESASQDSSSTSSDIAQHDVSLDGLRSDPCLGGWELGSRDFTTVFFPDYLVYHDIYSVDSVLVFSSSSLEIKGCNAKGNQEKFCFRWVIGDLVGIESQWLGRYDTAMVYIHLHSKNAEQPESTRGDFGINELKFAVVEPNWYEKQEAIMALDDRYKTLWNTVLDTLMWKDELGQLGEPHKKRYFPSFDEPFEDVIYPKGDSDAVSISKRDVDLLQPETFVNDTIIDFYIKYLKNKIQPDERHRFHFFNSFFFRKLADLDKDPSSAFEGRAAFQRVRKWTRKVNLFEKDYVFVPVNFNYHWSLIVICHPGEVAKFEDKVAEKSLKVPCILHMDSIRGSHTDLKGLVQSYLWEEWKEKRNETSEDISVIFSNMRFLSLELPQQQNSYDCGLFLLHYVELFLEDAPATFSPFKITKFSKFLTVDWFPSAEASLKRVVIQRLIHDVLDRYSLEASPGTSSGKDCSSTCPKNNYDHHTAMEFLSDRCSPLDFHLGTLPNSHAVEGIEMTHLPTTSLRSSQYVNEPGLVLSGFFPAGATSGQFFDAPYPVFNQTASLNGFNGAMSSIEDEVEASQQLVYPPMETEFQQSTGTTIEGCDFPYSSRDYAVGATWNGGLPVNQSEDGDINLSQETSSSGNSLEELDENEQVKEDVSLKEEVDNRSSPLTENMDDVNSQCHMSIPDDSINGDAHTSFGNNLDEISNRNHVMLETERKTCVNLRLIDDESVLELELQHTAKKVRLTPPEGDGLAGSLSNDLHL